jgi:tRNA nucleotidyltransferase (CCA-adding enzyme)
MFLASRGANVYAVGGAVRDWLLGAEPKDMDFEVYGLGSDHLESLLSQLGETDLVGKSFGIYKVRIAGEVYDFSLPRKDSKMGTGHRGFEVETNPFLDPVEASARRDFTINSMFYDMQKNQLLDPHGGLADLKKGVLRHTSAAFAEDPLRVLRAVQFAARFKLTLHAATASICRSMAEAGTFHQLPRERVLEEFRKFLVKGKHHRQGFAVLGQSGWMEFFPEIANLSGVPQDPIWHPEGDVLKHTGHCLESLSLIPAYSKADEGKKFMFALAVLCHDFGKPETTKTGYCDKALRVTTTSRDHQNKGVVPTRSFLRRMGVSPALAEKVETLVRYHMEHIWVDSDSQVKHLASKLAPRGLCTRLGVSIADLGVVVEADHSGRPPNPSGLPSKMRHIMDRASSIGCLQHPCPSLIGGSDIVEMGIPQGKIVGAIVKEVYRKQLDSDTWTKNEAMGWVKKNLRRIGSIKAGLPPILSGGDLRKMGLESGSVYSDILNKSYLMQLQGEIKNREQALALARSWAEEKSRHMSERVGCHQVQSLPRTLAPSPAATGTGKSESIKKIWHGV